MPISRPTRRQLLSALVLGPLATGLPWIERTVEGAPPHKDTLADLLPATFDWDPAKRGALLIVDPAGTERSKTSEQSVPRNGIGTAVYLLRALPAYERKAVPLGTVTVVAPSTMTRIADEPPRKPRLWEGLDRAERIQYLATTFTPAQWAKCASTEGMGAADLAEGDQRTPFSRCCPIRSWCMRRPWGRTVR